MMPKIFYIFSFFLYVLALVCFFSNKFPQAIFWILAGIFFQLLLTNYDKEPK